MPDGTLGSGDINSPKESDAPTTRTVTHAWIDGFMSQDPRLDRPPYPVVRRIAAVLSTYTQKFDFDSAAMLDFVNWYWRWRVPHWPPEERGDGGIAPVQPGVLARYVGEYRTWLKARAAYIRRHGVDQAISKDVSPDGVASSELPLSWRRRRD